MLIHVTVHRQRPKRAGNWKNSGQGNYFPKLGSTGKVRTFRPFYYYHFHHHHDRRRHHHHHHHHSLGSPPLSFNLLVMSIMSCIVVESPRPTTCSRRPQVRPEQRFSHPCAWCGIRVHQESKQADTRKQTNMENITQEYTREIKRELCRCWLPWVSPT